MKNKDEEFMTTYEKLPSSIKNSTAWVMISQSDISIRSDKISQIDSSQLEFNKIIGNGSI